MTRRNWIARTRNASGRFLFALALATAGCQAGVSDTTEGPAPRYRDPILEPGSLSSAREARAASLYREALEALEAGNASDARSLATQVVQLYPQAPVSGVALWVLAQASLRSGAADAADEEAGRFAELLEPGDPRAAEARLLQADAQARRGDPAARLDRLLRISPEAPTNSLIRAVSDARAAVAELSGTQLDSILARTPEDAPVRPVALARQAALFQVAGREAEGRRLAQAALDGGARGVDSLTAAAVLSGRDVREMLGGAAPVERTLTLGTVLPTGGSPAFRDFARSVAEGIEVAAATWLEGVTVELDERDDKADPALAAQAVAELERTDAIGVVGFLEAGALDAAADRRRGTLPLVSPTSRTARGEGVYTLSGADPRGAAAMARYAARQGFVRVAMIHSRSPESVEEADAFASALASEGIPMAGRFPYDAGVTTFRDQISGAQEALRGAEIRALGLGPEDTLHVEVLEPVALFVPAPDVDVELLAPQITFYGLDTLAIRVLGTGGWTAPRTLQAVDNRHTNGVVATAPVDGGPGSNGYARFREAYEEHFQRTLVSPVPALGYDAALLLLEAARSGARTPRRLLAALEDIRDLEGATGSFSVVGGRVVRRTRVVRIEHGILIPTG